jgi:uncharacterized protein YceK
VREVLILLVVLLTGCDRIAVTKDDRSPSPGWGKARIVDSDILSRKIGRFQPLPRVDAEAQMILDTATGCVFQAGAVTAVDTDAAKPKSCEIAKAVPPEIQKIMDKYGVKSTGVGTTK